MSVYLYYDDPGIYMTTLYLVGQDEPVLQGWYNGSYDVGYVPTGRTVAVEATPANGYSFDHWEYSIGSYVGAMPYTDYSNVLNLNTSYGDLYIRAVSSSGGGSSGQWSFVDYYDINISSGSSYYNLYMDQYTAYRFRINMPSQGELSVYTSGSVDTIGYFGSSVTFNQATGTPSSYSIMDDDSNGGGNFLITTESFNPNEFYYVWVRGYDSSNYGWTTVYFDFTPAQGVTIDPYYLGMVMTTTSGVYYVDSEHVIMVQCSFPRSGTVTVYTTGDVDTYGYFGSTPDTPEGGWNFSTNQPLRSSIAKDDNSGDSTNFRFNVTVQANVSYVVWIKVGAPYASGYTVLNIVPPENPYLDLWDWGIQNVNASAALTYAAYSAVTTHGACSNFNYVVWNDMCDKVNQVLSYIGDTWRTTYAGFVPTKMTASDKTLTAVRFNSLRYNIGIHYSTGLSEVHQNDPVLGSYFTTLTDCINYWIAPL